MLADVKGNGMKLSLLVLLAGVVAGCQAPARRMGMGPAAPAAVQPPPSQVQPQPVAQKPVPPAQETPAAVAEEPPPDPLQVECKKWLGTPYRLGGSNRQGVDCSGFTSQIYLNVYKIKLPRTAADQFMRGRNVMTSQLQPGDLIFFQTSAAAPITHVGIYLGDGQFMHSSTRYGVILSHLYEGYYSQAFRGAKRIRNSSAGEEKGLAPVRSGTEQPEGSRLKKSSP
jgi:cell wall-associated NlpC family hydrolase